MLTDTCELSKTQQKECKRQANSWSLLSQRMRKGYLKKASNRETGFTGYTQSLRLQGSSFKGESVMPKAQDYRWMGLY